MKGGAENQLLLDSGTQETASATNVSTSTDESQTLVPCQQAASEQPGTSAISQDPIPETYIEETSSNPDTTVENNDSDPNYVPGATKSLKRQRHFSQ